MTPLDCPTPKIERIGKHSAQLSFTGTALYRFKCKFLQIVVK